MKPIVRNVLLAAAVAAASLWLTYRFCYLRAVCNVRAGRAQQSVMAVMRMPQNSGARISARQAIDEMNHCLECWPNNIQLYMMRAAALRVFDRPAEASLDYRRALLLDRRAELWLNVGLSELEAGRDEQAFDALTTAAFMFIPYLEEIPEPMQSRVRAAVMPAFERMLHGQASPEEVEQLRQRVIRAPL